MYYSDRLLAESERDALLPPKKPKEEFNVTDGDRLTERLNLEAILALRHKGEWEWEWGVIRPLLMEHFDWNYGDAYRHIMMNGGFPKPPRDMY